jgi:hypothetical protein
LRNSTFIIKKKSNRTSKDRININFFFKIQQNWVQIRSPYEVLMLIQKCIGWGAAPTQWAWSTWTTAYSQQAMVQGVDFHLSFLLIAKLWLEMVQMDHMKKKNWLWFKLWLKKKKILTSNSWKRQDQQDDFWKTFFNLLGETYY